MRQLSRLHPDGPAQWPRGGANWPLVVRQLAWARGGRLQPARRAAWSQTLFGCALPTPVGLDGRPSQENAVAAGVWASYFGLSALPELGTAYWHANGKTRDTPVRLDGGAAPPLNRIGLQHDGRRSGEAAPWSVRTGSAGAAGRLVHGG